MPVALFAGGISHLPDGEPTGIYKARITTAIALGPEGFVGDAQADRRVHGGPEKAVHHYAAEHYAELAARFPFAAAAFVPGALGENLSTRGLTEENVHPGDVFALGEARLQVSQPRSPCWKINARFGGDKAEERNIARHIGLSGHTGWYYRVLRAGVVQPDDGLVLVERQPGSISLAELGRLWREHRPSQSKLEAAMATPGLNEAWREKIRTRLAWLRQAADGAGDAPVTYHERQ
jgi:MOSC domain-containing protein YiiM